MSPVTTVFLISMLFGLAKVCTSIQCYKCVYDPREPERSSVFSFASLSMKSNTRRCGPALGKGDTNSITDSCTGLMYGGCSVVTYKTSKGKYYARGCVAHIACTNHSIALTAGNLDQGTGNFECCKTDLCNKYVDVNEISGVRRIGPFLSLLALSALLVTIFD